MIKKKAELTFGNQTLIQLFFWQIYRFYIHLFTTIVQIMHTSKQLIQQQYLYYTQQSTAVGGWSAPIDALFPIYDRRFTLFIAVRSTVASHCGFAKYI